MAESIFRRVSRVMNAKLEDAVDRMERSGNGGVMREAIREVERVVDEVQSDFETATTRRLQALRQQRALHDKIMSLTEKATYAVAQGREDLAEAALSRQVGLEEQAGKLDDVQASAREDETRLAKSLEGLKARKLEMEEALAAFLDARRAAAPDEEPAGPQGRAPRRGVAQRVHRAEQAFDRAIAGAGGLARADGDTIMRVAEIDLIKKRATVTARLAALKQDVAAAH